MKRLGSSDSIGALMSICPPTEEQSPGGGDQVYSREFQSMLDGLDDEGCLEEPGHVAEKKRRLSVDQVKALEKSFEVENKLEPERKVKLAQELGLQPRQVAVWFQNRRARWKTKQLERDYGVLKANFDALKHNFDSLRQDNEALLEQIRVLRSKLDEENSESNVSIKEDEALIFKSCHKIKEETNAVASPVADCLAGSEANYKTLKNHNVSSKNSFLADLKEGLSDSDSSAILNDDNSMNPASSTQNQQLFISSSPTSSSFRFNTFLNSKYSETEDPALATAKVVYQPHFVKMEEHNFFGGEETCNFFSDEQAPSLHWYSPDQWT